MRKLLIIGFILVLSSCIDREPNRFCIQSAPERITYTFKGDWPTPSSEVTLFYLDRWGDIEDTFFSDDFAFTVYFDDRAYERIIVADMFQSYGEEPITGVLTIREGPIVLGEYEFTGEDIEVLIDICN